MNSPKILVIDGDPKNLQILRESLEAARFQVVTTGSGEEGWMLIQSEKPNIIVSEVDIPGIDGFQLLDRLQKDPTHASIPLVFLTNRRNLEDRIKSLRTGVKDYMIKPLHVKEVIARLQMILRRMERAKTDESDTTRKIVGRLEDHSVEQLVENYGVEKRTGVLSLYDRFDRNGEIYFQEGAVVNARLGNFRAEKAVYQMLPWDRGHYIMTFKNVTIPPEISVSNLGLLLQGFKRMQEREKLLHRLPGMDKILVRTPLFEQILKKKNVGDDALKFISLFDGKRTLANVLADSVYEDIKTLQRIVRLYEQRFVQVVGEPFIEPVAPRSSHKRLSMQKGPVEPGGIKHHAQPPLAGPSKIVREDPGRSEEDSNEPVKTPVDARLADDRPAIEIPHDDGKSASPPESNGGSVVPEDSKTLKPTPYQKRAEKSSLPSAFQQGSSESGPAQKPMTVADDVAPHRSGPNGSMPYSKEDTRSDGDGGDSQPSVVDDLLAARGAKSGHFVVISGNHRYRQQFVSTLTAGNFASKSFGNQGEIIEIGQIRTPQQRSFEIIGLSTEQRFVHLLEQVSDTLVGYVILISGENPSRLKYTGYLIDSLKKKIQAPYLIALVRLEDSRKVPLDFVRYSLQLDEKEQIVEVNVMNQQSLLHVISQLKEPDYLDKGPSKTQNMLQST